MMQIARLFLKPRPKLVIGQSSQDQRTIAGPLEPQAQRLSSKKDTFSHPRGLDRVFCNPIRPHRTRVHSIPEAKFCVISRGGRRGVQREPRGASFLATPTFRGPSRWLPVSPTSVASVRPHKKVQPSHITQRGWGGEAHIKPPPISNGGPCTPPSPPPHPSFGRFLIFVSCCLGICEFV